MKEIRTVDAVGQRLCHDITQIVRGVTKDARFRKGHVICEADIPVLLSLGKDHIYIWDADGSQLHEDEAADVLRALCQNAHMHATAPKEGKIELVADCDGVFQVDAGRLNAVNEIEDMTIATLPQNMPVQKGRHLAGMRVTPLFIGKERMEEVKKVAGSEPLLRIRPYRKNLKVGVVTTGTEVFLGRIEDTFTPVLAAKLKAFGLAIAAHRLTDESADDSADKNEYDDHAVSPPTEFCQGNPSYDVYAFTPLNFFPFFLFPANGKRKPSRERLSSILSVKSDSGRKRRPWRAGSSGA